MAPSTLAGTIQAISGTLTALLVMIVAAIGLYRSRKVEKKVDEADAKIAEVHIIVNQQRTDTMNYQRALIAALNKHGIEVPTDQSTGNESA